MKPFSVSNKINLSVILALILTGVMIAWVISGSIYTSATDQPDFAPDPEQTSLPKVETQYIDAQRFQPSIKLQGQLEPIQQTQVTSRIQSYIETQHVKLGEYVDQGTLLITLDAENRLSQLTRAEAELRVAQANQRATERLIQQNLGSETELLRQQAATAAALAERDRLRLELKHTEIRAPFSGFIEELPYETGSSIQAGDHLVHLVNTQQLKMTGQVPQQQVKLLSTGLPVEATLLDGRKLGGQVSFVASLAEPQTRSFRVEALVDNAEKLRLAGASATLSIQLPDQLAHRFSPAHLSLNNQGRTGIRIIDSDSKIVFHEVEILSLDTNGVWVSGLPDRIELVTQGAGFVELGQQVEAVRIEAHKVEPPYVELR
ncbi:MAG: efflux RND transporter periplasmic adaptor subunit [Oceanospirillales bacterium]|nr:MAG: efflux RND transporter periplasmic adaptor subunit [Oceanospirillales bacterium]